MPAQVARRGERHGDGGENHRDQRGQAEKLLRAFERLPHFRPQVAHVLHPLAGLQLVLRPSGVRVGGTDVARVGDEQPVRRPVAGLQQVGRRHVVEIDEQARRKRDEAAGDFRFLLDDGADGQRGFADRESIADIHTQPLREPQVRPRLAGRRDAGRDDALGPAGTHEPDGAAQRITGGDGLDVGEDRAAARIAGRALDHAVELDHRCRVEAAPSRFLRERLRQRPVAGDHQVGAQQKIRLPRQRRLDAIGEERDGAHTCHRQHQRGDEHGQLTGAPVAPEHAQRQARRVRGHRAITPAARRRPARRRRDAPTRATDGGHSARRPRCRA